MALCLWIQKEKALYNLSQMLSRLIYSLKKQLLPFEYQLIEIQHHTCYHVPPVLRLNYFQFYYGAASFKA